MKVIIVDNSSMIWGNGCDYDGDNGGYGYNCDWGGGGYGDDSRVLFVVVVLDFVSAINSITWSVWKSS